MPPVYRRKQIGQKTRLYRTVPVPVLTLFAFFGDKISLCFDDDWMQQFRLCRAHWKFGRVEAREDTGVIWVYKMKVSIQDAFGWRGRLEVQFEMGTITLKL